MTHIPLSWSEYAANKIKMYFLSEPTSEPCLPRIAEQDSDVQVQKDAQHRTPCESELFSIKWWQTLDPMSEIKANPRQNSYLKIDDI